MTAEREPETSLAAPPRRRRWWYIVGVTVLVLVVGLEATIYLLRQAAERELAALQTDLDATDPGWRLEEIEARRVNLPPEQNSAVRIQAVKRLLPNQWPAQVATQSGGDLKGDNPAAPSKAEPPFDEQVSDLEPQIQLSKELTEELRAELQKVAPALAEARPLADMPQGRFTVAWAENGITAILPCQDARAAGNLLRLDAALLVQDGDPDKALTSVRGILNAGRAIGDEPTLISQLVRIALEAVAVRSLERVLAQGEPSEAALKAVQDLLEKEAAEPLLLYAARGERANNHRAMNWMTAGGDATSRAEAFTSGILARRSHAPHLRMMTEFVEIARLPVEEQAARLKEFDKPLTDLPFLSQMLVPAFSKVAQAFQRSQAILRGAIAAVAAERYRRQKGSWPSSHAQLVEAGLLRAVPVDPYDGQPLRLRALADGVVIYSVGPDRTDDGGNLNRKDPTAAGADLGFRLWDVKARRQPPAPAAPAPKDKEP
jgi:hypothetical protein